MKSSEIFIIIILLITLAIGVYALQSYNEQRQQKHLGDVVRKVVRETLEESKPKMQTEEEKRASWKRAEEMTELIRNMSDKDKKEVKEALEKYDK